MKAVGLMVTALALCGCVRHIYPYGAKVRSYKSDTYAPRDAERTAGSLWSEASPGLFEDARAQRVGDILTIRIDERSDANRDASTRAGRKNSTELGVSAFFVAMQRLATQFPGLDPAALVGASSANEFDGEGSTSRSGRLTATLPVRVKNQLQNGDLFVEGTKVLLLNDEESQLYLSGVVRPIDILPDNSVASSLLADVELEYTGRGVISEQQSPGWLARLGSYLWPF
ncbi:MAG: flagellar basal body L-ring protein FlgH [Deltaproteobacteria bacterium]|nr:flagellar basal body L-ring protein FlgH [Deltaproteobacteria bacterium]